MINRIQNKSQGLMKTRGILSTLALSLLIINTFGQTNTIDLTFTSINNSNYVQLDSIKVMNRSQWCDTVLFWPDTVLSIYYVGISEITNRNNSFQVFTNYPNPVYEKTIIPIFVPEYDLVKITITDIHGRIIVFDKRMLNKGIHYFQFIPDADNIYFFVAQWKGKYSSIKIVRATSQNNGIGSLKYVGSDDTHTHIKSTQNILNFSYNPGDELLYIGYAENLQAGILDFPEESKTYIFQFASNIPCPDLPTVEYDGQVYNTIQIFSQCWIKENLNVGTMIQGSQNMTDNGVKEKYCYNNEPDSCTKYGGLYQWDEMMQYTTQQGVQGICPPDWHIPTDEEWKVLEGAVDSQYGIGNVEWEGWDEARGIDAGLNLKAIDDWYLNGNGSDLFGFSGLPGGVRSNTPDFVVVFLFGYWWTTTQSKAYFDQAYFRHLSYGSPKIGRYHSGAKDAGFSVRCIKNE
jgi:uncharacterized protein (TIGR02145 family)